MAKQDFETIDYFGPVVVAAIFAVALFLISFFIINFFCITKYDDVTQFEKFGAKRNWRLGPHRMLHAKGGGLILKPEDDDDDTYYA
ncbi:hypothetical protein V3C99_001741 [Haemonchus contortus]|uniref:Uncharacterized protein n=1 Tax=Haemonchus contortus TaxID=6289 RepID=A0A7I4YE45_HAECO|nr:Hypothetical protein CBG16246 [Haemonchus contortus]CDJ97536.1 Hypothetical protein CBG16246 [Haemonchus contortus]